MSRGERLREQEAQQLWHQLCTSTEGRYAAFNRASASSRVRARQRLLLALELRWKLEEQVLLPALQGADAADRGADQEIGMLRDLAELVSDNTLEAAAAGTVLAALDGMAMLHSQRIEQALAQATRTRQIDSVVLAREMEGLLNRWRGEQLLTGGIEDEEADPVGRAPQ